MQRKPSHSDDLALARGALAGDEAARQALLERLRCVPRFVAALHRRAGSPLDRSALEDLAQNVLLVVWRKLSDYRAEASLETWAYRFCHFETLNAVRRWRRASRWNGDALPPDDEMPGVHMPVDGDLMHEEALSLLGCLSRREAEVMEMRHFLGFEVEEIARELGVSISSVKTHYYRGLEKLRARLAARSSERR